MPQYVEVPGHGVVEFPDGMNDDQIASAIKANMSPQQPVPQQSHNVGGDKSVSWGVVPGAPAQAEPTQAEQIRQQDKNVLGGLVRGAGSIGATLLAPVDAAARALGVENSWIGRTDRREAMDAGLQQMGSDPESAGYKTGKITSEIGGTAGVGSLLAKGAQAVPALTRAVPNLVPALQSGGFKLGQQATTKAQMLANGLTRTGAGAATGGAMAGMVNPEDAGKGAMLGAAMPGVAKVLGEAGKATNWAGKAMARRLMQSALKPTLKQLKTGDARVAVDTLLDLGINPNSRGVEKIGMKIDDLNTLIADKLKGSNASVNRQDVLGYLDDVSGKFGNQVSPTSDLNAIKGVADDFMTHPAIAGNSIPVQQAQTLKQGTYKALSGKYGEAGSAATEAQKALARGLKDKIADAVPGIGQLNAEEARLIKTLGVAERRALMELNKNPVGLSLLAGNKAAFLGFMADKSAAFKALAARAINRAAETPSLVNPLADKLANPAIRGGMLAISGNQGHQQGTR